MCFGSRGQDSVVLYCRNPLCTQNFGPKKIALFVIILVPFFFLMDFLFSFKEKRIATVPCNLFSLISMIINFLILMPKH